MLPPEAFAEAVAFLRLVDVGALVVTNSLLSSIALKASTAIRREEFPGLQLYISNRWIDTGRAPSADDKDGHFCWSRVAMLTFPSERETADFIVAAFPNCIFGGVAFSASLSKPLMDAMDRVGDAVIINGALRPHYAMCFDDTLNLVRKFRKVKALLLREEMSGNEADGTAILRRESGVQELHYYPAVSAALQEINSQIFHSKTLLS